MNACTTADCPWWTLLGDARAAGEVFDRCGLGGPVWAIACRTAPPKLHRRRAATVRQPRILRGGSYRRGIRTIRVPVLLVHGERDRLVPVQQDNNHGGQRDRQLGPSADVDVVSAVELGRADRFPRQLADRRGGG